MIIVPPVCPRCGGPTQRGKSHCVYCKSYIGETTHSPIVVYKTYEAATDNGWFSPSLSPSPSAEASASPSYEAEEEYTEHDEVYQQKIIDHAEAVEKANGNWAEKIIRKLGF